MAKILGQLADQISRSQRYVCGKSIPPGCHSNGNTADATDRQIMQNEVMNIKVYPLAVWTEI